MELIQEAEFKLLQNKPEYFNLLQVCVCVCEINRLHTWNWMILSCERQRYILSVSFR